MALPAEIKTVVVTIGPATDFTGQVLQGGSVTFQPSTTVVHAASGTPLFARAVKVNLDDAGTGSIALPATDQPGFTDGKGGQIVNWTYKVTWAFTDRQVIVPASYSIQLPQDTPNVDLDLLLKIEGETGQIVALPNVTSVNGATGAVTIPTPGIAVVHWDTDLNAWPARPSVDMVIWTGCPAGTADPSTSLPGDFVVEG